jgi:outer membrane murein-binding lipoprotein Lpp
MPTSRGATRPSASGTSARIAARRIGIDVRPALPKGSEILTLERAANHPARPRFSDPTTMGLMMNHELDREIHGLKDRRLLELIFERVMTMTTDLSNLQAELDELASDAEAAAVRVQDSLDALGGQVADLTAQIAELTAGAVTQEQIDTLAAQADAIDSAVDAIDPTIVPEPPVEEVPAEEPVP